MGLRDVLDEPSRVFPEVRGRGWAGARRDLHRRAGVRAPGRVCDHRREYTLPVHPTYCGVGHRRRPAAAGGGGRAGRRRGGGGGAARWSTAWGWRCCARPAGVALGGSSPGPRPQPGTCRWEPIWRGRVEVSRTRRTPRRSSPGPAPSSRWPGTTHRWKPGRRPAAHPGAPPDAAPGAGIRAARPPRSASPTWWTWAPRRRRSPGSWPPAAPVAARGGGRRHPVRRRRHRRPAHRGARARGGGMSVPEPHRPGAAGGPAATSRGSRARCARALILGLLASLVGVGGSLAQPWPLQWVVDNILQPAAAGRPSSGADTQLALVVLVFVAIVGRVRWRTTGRPGSCPRRACTGQRAARGGVRAPAAAVAALPRHPVGGATSPRASPATWTRRRT